MKKVFCYLLVAVMLVAGLATSAMAETAVETVTVEFKAVNNPGFANYGVKIEYDADVLTLKAIEKGELSQNGFFDANVNTGIVGYANTEDVTGDGVLFTATFEVSGEAAPGTYAITAVLDELSTANAANEAVTFTVTGGSVTVTCAHQWGEWTETKAATCTEKGEETRTCGKCGATETRETDKIAHTEEVIPGKAATCTETGLTEGKKCSVCGEILVAQEEIPALGHTEEVIPGKAATCTETGLTEGKKCSVCGEILVAQEEIPMTEHVWKWVVDKEATTEETGVKHEECENCGAKRNEGTVIDKLDPDLDDEPGTGDITPMLTMGTMGVVAVLTMAAAAVYVFKRKAVK